MAQGGEGSINVRCSFKTATVCICAFNIVAVFFILHLVVSPLYLQPGSPFLPVKSLRQPHPRVVGYTLQEIKRIQEFHNIRRSVEPHELIKRVKEIELEAEKEAEKDNEAGVVRQRVAAELAQRLKELKETNSQRSQQALDDWRRKKLDQAKRHEEAKAQQDIKMMMQEHAKEVVTKMLEQNWGSLLEEAGLDAPAEAPSNGTITGALLQNDSEMEDGIIPGPPLPIECHAEPHTDYDGVAVRWGLTHHTESAADCCQACLDQAKAAKKGDMKCNVWVFCPAEKGCFSPDIYEHKHQECWLKQSDQPKLNFKGRYDEEYRRRHTTAPLVVPWVSGVTV
ncbi:hypothetical protein O6H91_15G019900 [Diphasiastrum complanatum]|uniref:Uncharacterized protein n=3 Tax=Diphasiastrum complanatum TaxID=34168 RepID=A0ACC2BGG2_DIPCM|nr:hypothetical protein O6H91_15G019900 [Diphasiastrum complanatum]KAJ7528787.1 hypothetical protein O6H91_15G019900 [Diphasiastrum complanatum]KAJ7528788.1 hypothetical protein O6H91_15G019900 [Diphasiastrum complanatum]